MNVPGQSAVSPTGSHESRENVGGDDLSSRSPTQRNSGLSYSFGSTRSHSSFSSRKSGAKPRASVPEAHESSQVLGGAGTSTRDYGAIEATPNPGTTRRSSNWNDTIVPEPRNGDGGDQSNHRNRHASEDEDGEPHRSRFSRFFDKYGSLELENKGSVARDHLALERTFLAWLRTSLAFASIGIAVTQLFRLNTSRTSVHSSGFGEASSFSSGIYPPQFDSSQIHAASASSRLRSVGKPLGSTFIGVAILILLIGFHRYFESQYWIIRGKFPASRGSVALTAFVAAALIVAALAVILAVSPSAVEQ
ncbi:hypothetical protein PDE_00172 [Penicillium oxalicum 114-2]|uniref:DUF202 domain-containing protein n=1 Tax=Penicillium oxalicum (strain 114-2 / CGMCC 5302) TaxID=933388 RepID=S7Z554_PENO1|nr:hypothetical protein PDE_00172 [Penicillium oxalicum 114-2]